MLPGQVQDSLNKQEVMTKTESEKRTDPGSEPVQQLIAKHRQFEASCNLLIERQDAVAGSLRSKRRASEGPGRDRGDDPALTNLIGRASNQSAEAIDEINQIEVQVRAIQFSMYELEAQILETMPKTASAMLQKIHFICDLLLFCSDGDMERYVIAIDEAAAALDTKRV